MIEHHRFRSTAHEWTEFECIVVHVGPVHGKPHAGGGLVPPDFNAKARAGGRPARQPSGAVSIDDCSSTAQDRLQRRFM